MDIVPTLLYLYVWLYVIYSWPHNFPQVRLPLVDRHIIVEQKNIYGLFKIELTFLLSKPVNQSTTYIRLHLLYKCLILLPKNANFHVGSKPTWKTFLVGRLTDKEAMDEKSPLTFLVGCKTLRYYYLPRQLYRKRRGSLPFFFFFFFFKAAFFFSASEDLFYFLFFNKL